MTDNRKLDRTIHLVVGPPASGKSTYIAKAFKGHVCVDIWLYQENCRTMRDTWESYVRHRRDCINIAKVYQRDFVVEHTMLRACRRAYYIAKLRPYGRLVCHYTQNAGLHGDAVLAVFEQPTTDEGFDEVVPIADA